MIGRRSGKRPSADASVHSLPWTTLRSGTGLACGAASRCPCLIREAVEYALRPAIQSRRFRPRMIKLACSADKISAVRSSRTIPFGLQIALGQERPPDHARRCKVGVSKDRRPNTRITPILMVAQRTGRSETDVRDPTFEVGSTRLMLQKGVRQFGLRAPRMRFRATDPY